MSKCLVNNCAPQPTSPLDISETATTRLTPRRGHKADCPHVCEPVPRPVPAEPAQAVDPAARRRVVAVTGPFEVHPTQRGNGTLANETKDPGRFFFDGPVKLTQKTKKTAAQRLFQGIQ